MGAEMVLGQLRGGDLLKVLFSDRSSSDLGPQLSLREWGKIGINNPYAIVINRDIMKDFLEKGVKLRPHQIHRTQIHVLGEKPHKIPEEFRDFIYPQDERQRARPHYAWIEEHKPTRTHFVGISGLTLWQDLKIDRNLILAHQKRKKRTPKSWEVLAKKTKLVSLTQDRMKAIEEAATPEALDAYLCDLLSFVGTISILEDILHETDHSYRYRTKYEFWISKKRWLALANSDLEADAEKAESRLDSLGDWKNMIYFRIRPSSAVKPKSARTAVEHNTEAFKRPVRKSGVFKVSREAVIGTEVQG